MSDKGIFRNLFWRATDNRPCGHIAHDQIPKCKVNDGAHSDRPTENYFPNLQFPSVL